MRRKSTSVSGQKTDAVRVAKDLCYPKEVIEKIKSAESGEEITRILVSARLGAADYRRPKKERYNEKGRSEE